MREIKESETRLHRPLNLSLCTRESFQAGLRRPTIDLRGVTARIYSTYSYAEDDN